MQFLASTLILAALIVLLWVWCEFSEGGRK